jgi:hypothetical protein
LCRYANASHTLVGRRDTVEIHIRLDAGFGDREYKVARLPDETGKADFPGDADLLKDSLRASNRIFPLCAVDRIGDLQILECVNRHPFIRHDLGVVQKEHAGREQQKKRTDEKPEVQVKISRPSVKQRIASSMIQFI